MGDVTDVCVKDLHSTTKTKDQIYSRFLLDIIIRNDASILELLSSKDQTLLVRSNALLVLDLCLHVFDRVTWLHIQGDGLSGQCLHKDLHSTTKTKDQM